MLADDNAAASHQDVGCLALRRGIIPAVGVLNVHVSLGHDGLNAQQERGVARYHLGIGEGTHIAHIGVCHGTGVHQLLELHAGHNAGYIARLIDIGEEVLEIVQTSNAGLITRTRHERDGRILLGGAEHVSLMTIGVGEDDVAAGFRQVNGGVLAGFILRDIVAHHDLLRVAGVDSQSLAGGGQTVNVGCVIAGVLIVNADQANFYAGRTLFRGVICGIIRGGVVSSAGGQTQRHGQGEEQRKKLLHSTFLLINHS